MDAVILNATAGHTDHPMGEVNARLSPHRFDRLQPRKGFSLLGEVWGARLEGVPVGDVEQAVASARWLSPAVVVLAVHVGLDSHWQFKTVEEIRVMASHPPRSYPAT